MRFSIATPPSRAALFAVLAGLCAFSATAAQPPVHRTPLESTADVGLDEFGECRSTNFVVTGTTRRIARRFAERAETHRKELAKAWLGRELPDWSSPCRVELQLTGGRLGGMSTFDFTNNSTAWSPVRIALNGPADAILSNSLPHEVTHTILADYFRRPLPRWADEGTAILCEGEAVQRRFDRMAQEMGRRWELFRLDYLFGLRDYPPRIDVFYAEGYSVTRFLVERKDRPTFLTFLRTGMGGDWAAAAKHCYGFESLEEMQAAWLDTLRQPIAQK
jgi:hypothetical protein